MSEQPVSEQYLECPGMPLAVYREVAAHLEQLPGVEVELIPRSSQMFDYDQSQIGRMAVRYPEALTASDRQRLEEILDYYGRRFGQWVALI